MAWLSWARGAQTHAGPATLHDPVRLHELAVHEARAVILHGARERGRWPAEHRQRASKNSTLVSLRKYAQVRSKAMLVRAPDPAVALCAEEAEWRARERGRL